MPVADEAAIVEEARRGDRRAFRLLVERHMKQAYDIAYGFADDHALAEDISQEAFIHAYEALGSFRGESAFSTWLHRIVVNLALNRTRRARRHLGLAAAELDPAVLSLTDMTTTVQNSEEAIHLERALHELPTLQRAVVILRHLEGLSTRQVSDILRCSEGTVKTHLFRGLRNMRKRLEFLRGGA